MLALQKLQLQATEPSHSIAFTMSQSTNSDGGALTDHMGRLSLSSAAATALPSSSPVNPSPTNSGTSGNASPNPSHRTVKSPLRRAPSSSSIGSNERSSPVLHRRISMNSLQGSQGVTPPRTPALRRTSSYLSSSPNANVSAKSSRAPPPEEPQKSPLTAAAVAHDFFAKDLAVNHGGSEVSGDAQAVVIIQDDCYGHRYSRPRTSKSGLNTIVERPERIHASLLGVATAYVRLGGRHIEGRAAPHPQREPTSLPPVPFKIHKTSRRLSLRSPVATGIHGVKWMNELSAMCDAAESRLAMGGKELSRTNDLDQPNGAPVEPKRKLHEGDLYLCAGSLTALEGALGGVCEAVDAVFGERGTRRAFVCIRPPGHHCSADEPSGFCWLNNVHVGIGHASMAHGLTHAAIIDFDLHHGDGSQAITWDHNSRIASLPKNTPISKKTAIGYFSLHDINSYPCEMGDDDKVRNASLCIENAHGQSIWNVHLQPWKTEPEFWALYEDRYLVVLAKARAFLRGHSDRLRQAPTHPKPRAAIFLSAGFDASEWESPHMQRHQVNVPTSFYARFTRDVVMMAEEANLGVDGRIISVLEGGYSDRALMSGVLSHMSGLSVSTGLSRPPSSGNGLGVEMSRRLAKVETNGPSKEDNANPRSGAVDSFDSNWWSLPCLEEIETLVNPPPTAAARKQRSDVKPTYTTATESYKAKIIAPPPGRRSLSGSVLSINAIPSTVPRAPSPPPPEVDWATAANELSKLLIPSDRETRSCRAEDLNAEATRARRDRQSGVGLPNEAIPVDAERMRLREKRPKQLTSAEMQETRLPSRASRRKTVADVKLLSSEAEGSSPLSDPVPMDQIKRHTRRRSSAASSVTSLNTDMGSDFSMASIAEARIEQDPLVIKKARPPTNTRPEIAKPKVVKRPTPVPRVPSDTSVPNKAPPQPPASKPIDKVPLSVNEDLKNQDVDRLSSNMRQMSIKLNVPPKEEYEAKQPKAKAAPRGRPTKAATAKAPKTSSPTKAKAKAPSPTKSKSKVAATEPAVVHNKVTTPDASNHGPITVPSVAAEEVIHDEPQLPSQPAPQTRAADSPTRLTVSMPSQPLPDSSMSSASSEMGPPPTLPSFGRSDPDAASLPTLPPSSPVSILQQPSTPITARRTKQDLPVFTATSPISFGTKHPSPQSPGIDHVLATSDVQSLDSEDRRVTLPRNTQPEAPVSATPHDAQYGATQTAQPLEKQQEPRDRSIWDIPDTPYRKKS